MNAPAAGKLSLVLFSGDFERVHYALAIAAAGRATGRPVTVLVTMQACRAFTAGGWREAPAAGAGAGEERDAAFAAAGVATFETLFAACVELGVRFIVCEMGLRAMGLEAGDVRPDAAASVAGLATFLHDAPNEGAMMFI